MALSTDVAWMSDMPLEAQSKVLDRRRGKIQRSKIFTCPNRDLISQAVSGHIGASRSRFGHQLPSADANLTYPTASDGEQPFGGRGSAAVTGQLLPSEALECPLQSGRSWAPEATPLAAISTRGPVRVAIAPESSQRQASDAFSRSNDHRQLSRAQRSPRALFQSI